MIEIIIERWDSATDGTRFLWSVWRDGKRIEMGGPHDRAEASEAAARRYCTAALGCEPDRVTRL
jgi:hypothetical protein